MKTKTSVRNHANAKKVISFLIVCIMFFSFIAPSTIAANSITGGFAGINTYSYCGYGNRAGTSYCTNFSNGLNGIRLSLNNISYTRSYNLANNNVTTNSISSASRVTFFVYSGHGVVLNTNYNNALHVNQPSSGSITSHSSLGETSSLINLKTTSISFPHKYVVLYTCNQLANSGSTTKENNIFNMLNGTRILFGFASQMYLDSREATLFTQNMKSQTLLDAFFNAARRYQTASSTPGIARAMGYTAAINDRISTSYNYAPAYSSLPGSFGYLGDDVTVE